MHVYGRSLGNVYREVSGNWRKCLLGLIRSEDHIMICSHDKGMIWFLFYFFLYLFVIRIVILWYSVDEFITYLIKLIFWMRKNLFIYTHWKWNLKNNTSCDLFSNEIKFFNSKRFMIQFLISHVSQWKRTTVSEIELGVYIFTN